MRKYLKELKPTSIDDLIAMNALYRPGPMQFIPQYIDCKHGRKTVEYPDAMLEEVLAPTYGIMVYQEQIMQVAQIMGGYSLGEADILRRAMGKKKVEEMEKQREIFCDRAVSRGVDTKVAGEVFDKMAFFAGYGFNKSHSAAYSVLAYQTAWFKANYTAEYMASVLTHNMGDIKKVSQFIEECRYLGITVDPPNVNTGAGQFVVRNGHIQYGLEAVKGVGSAAVEYLVNERELKGEFLSLFDFAARMDLRSCNRKTFESLIEAGAFDSLNPNRATLWESLDDALTYSQRKQADAGLNQFSLFGSGAPGSELQEPKLKEARPWTNMEKLKKERELIGFYLSGHPLDRFRDDIALFCSHNLGSESLAGLSDRSMLSVSGIIHSMKRVTDKKGRPFAFFNLEDEFGTVEVIAFSNTFDQYMNLIMPDNLVVVEGSSDTRSGMVKIIANTIDRIENLREKNQTRIQIRLKLITEELDADELKKIAVLFEANRGKTPVTMDVISPNNPRLKMRSRNFTIDPTDALIRELRTILGEEKVSFEKIEL
jgi:DNA polymerase-3 subunit alpha